MTNDISKDELPSAKHYNELKKSMNYNEINDVIMRTKPPSYSDSWIKNFNTYSSNYLSKYPPISTNDNPNKRCRDVVFFLEDIKKGVTQSQAFEGQNNMIIGNINNYLKTMLMPEGYDYCPINSNDENKLYTENIKQLDDLCEDITYINEKLDEINNSSQCKDIKDHIVEESRSVKAKYNHSSEYNDILKYYRYESLQDIESAIENIKCKNPHDASSDGMPELPGKHTPILIVLPIFGIILLSFFLYKLTPLGPFLNTKILKKIKYWKITDDKDIDQILEYPSEIPQTNIHDKGYHMLYNTLGDS
ncbi:PIR Superfamily Protein [Plasmodium ovale wallikeri]|uniref:PIR Superfamily Protein n=1 Tax=Plasmodium ovale wallikeri TaxID=864142 RepID=A0A1A9ART7_PLAOA|nr:PIR Superfamily Protein [Plasmodium ovale wallikeri]